MEFAILTRLFQAAFWAAIALAFGLAVMPDPTIVLTSPSDKVQHAVAFVVLAVLATFAYPSISALRWLIMLSVFGGLIEIAQLIPATHRNGDIGDWAVDTAAAAAVLCAVHIWRQSRALANADT
jgi:hypothetical protein